MDEQPNLREFLNEVSSFSEDEAAPAAPKKSAPAKLDAIGQVVEIAGSGSQIRMNGAALMALQSHSDPSVAMSGQVGSQVNAASDGPLRRKRGDKKAVWHRRRTKRRWAWARRSGREHR